MNDWQEAISNVSGFWARLTFWVLVMGLCIGSYAAEAPKLPEIVTLRVQNAYKDAVLASNNLEAMKVAVINASPDVQRAQAEFQKKVDEYNALVLKEAKEQKLPDGATITIDPATKDVTVKLAPEKPAEVKK